MRSLHSWALQGNDVLRQAQQQALTGEKHRILFVANASGTAVLAELLSKRQWGVYKIFTAALMTLSRVLCVACPPPPRDGEMVVSLGTSGTLFGKSATPIIDPSCEVCPFCDATGAWLPLVCTLNCTKVSMTGMHHCTCC